MIPLLRRAGQAALLLAVLAVGAFVRFDRLGAPSYWLDEILGDILTTRASAEPPWRWATGLETEHGPLYYAVQLATRTVGHDEAAGRLGVAILGTATIAVVWCAALALGAGTAGAATCAFLIAVSPLHVYYSREARPYGMLIFLTAALLVMLLRPPRVAAVGVVLVAMLYTTAVAAPVVAAAALVALAARRFAGDPSLRSRYLQIVGVSLVTLLAFALLYRAAPKSSAATDPFPPLDIELLRTIARGFSVSADGREGHPLTALLLALSAAGGAVTLARRDRRSAAVVVGMTTMPMLLSLAALKLAGHWFALRYVLPGLVGFLVLAGIGVVSFARLCAGPFRGRWPTVAAITAGIVVAAALTAYSRDVWGAVRTESFRKLDWRAIGAALESHVRTGDAIVFAEPWSDVCLRYYLRHLPAGVRVVPASDVPNAEMVVARSQASWLVTVGVAGGGTVRSWMCRYPLILASPLEEFRLHYAPTERHFLQQRAGTEDLRAFSAATGLHRFRLHLGRTEDEDFLGDGWAGREGSDDDAFRWAMAREATVLVPRAGRAARVVRLRAVPLEHPGLPPQTMRVSVNGNAIAHVTMNGESPEYAFDAPARFWRDGINVLSFHFGRVNAPFDLDPRQTDRRPLAASVMTISIDNAGLPPETRRSLGGRGIGLAAAGLLDVRNPGRALRSRFPAGQLSRAAVEALLGRLGYDPEGVWPRLASGERSLEDVTESIAWDGACEDDRTFLKRAFAVLLERDPNGLEEIDLLARLRTGATRKHIIGRILRAGDFGSAMLERTARRQ